LWSTPRRNGTEREFGKSTGAASTSSATPWISQSSALGSRWTTPQCSGWAPATTFVLSANLNAEYNFLRGRFSPLLRAGLGLYDITDNAGYWSTYGETDLSWNVGGGLRWNLSDHFVLKLIGGASWTNLKDSSSTAEFGFVTLGIGATF